jgi:iron complex transport system substrate-binding protein
MKERRFALLFLLLISVSTIQTWASDGSRIVSAGGAVTEIIFALGAGERVVATDISSLWPIEVHELPRIGYLRTLSAEGILALHPELLLTTQEAGPPPVLEQLKATHVRVEQVPSGFTPESVEIKIRSVAKALKVESQGDDLIRRFQTDWKKTESLLSKYSDQPKVLFILAHSGGSPMVAGRNTAADAMLQLAHARNASNAFDGYKPLTAESASLSDADVILVTTEGINELGGFESLWRNQALTLTPAGKQHRAVAMDSLYLLGFGPRLPEAVLDLAKQLRQK